MAINYRTQELWDYIYDLWTYELKKWDKQWTIDKLKNGMERILQHEEYMKSKDKYYEVPKEMEDEFNEYKNSLKNLWVSFDDFKWRYYTKHPTPQMEARDKAWDMLDEYVYNIVQKKSKDIDADKQEAKRIFVENLTWLVNDWWIDDNIGRIKRFVDAYNSMFQKKDETVTPQKAWRKLPVGSTIQATRKFY